MDLVYIVQRDVLTPDHIQPKLEKKYQKLLNII